MKKLYILEGADGTGKTTLSNAILAKTKGHLLHASFSEDWNIPSYHETMYLSAFDLLGYQPVIFDRWSVSEEVYANAFRGGSLYSADKFIDTYILDEKYGIGYENVVLIYCSNDKAVENHKENSKLRDEMFDDMSPVVREYEKYMNNTKLNWIRYDFSKVDMNEFVENITK